MLLYNYTSTVSNLGIDPLTVPLVSMKCSSRRFQPLMEFATALIGAKSPFKLFGLLLALAQADAWPASVFVSELYAGSFQDPTNTALVARQR